MIAGLGILVVASIIFGALTEPWLGVAMFVTCAIGVAIVEIVDRWL
ncbi:MAG: hypothetical protein ACM358_14070 [Gemmatimonadota bacterium]